MKFRALIRAIKSLNRLAKHGVKEPFSLFKSWYIKPICMNTHIIYMCIYIVCHYMEGYNSQIGPFHLPKLVAFTQFADFLGTAHRFSWRASVVPLGRPLEALGTHFCRPRMGRERGQEYDQKTPLPSHLFWGSYRCSPLTVPSRLIFY